MANWEIACIWSRRIRKYDKTLEIALIPEKTYSLREYVRLEKSTNEKFEFLNGKVWSVSTANYLHCVLSQNLLVAIESRIRQRGGDDFLSDMRVKVPAYLPYRYPDLSCSDGIPEYENLDGQDVLINPRLIIEILSDSTEAFDRGDKFSYYKSIESFSEYLLVAQHRPHVSQLVKHGDGFWANYEFNELSDLVELRSVGCSLPLAAIFRDVIFPPANLSGSETVQSTEQISPV